MKPRPEYAELLELDAEELYEHAPAGYLSSLEDGTLVKVNGTFLEWTGYAREDLVGGKRLHDLLAPGARIYYETHYAPLLHMQGSVREIAVEIVRADRSRLPVLLNSTLHRVPDGRAIVRTTVFDASDRRRYEQELLRARTDAESRARAALALEYVNEGVVLVSRDGRVEIANRAAGRILGLGPESLGRAVEDAVPGWAEIADRIPLAEDAQRAQPALLPLVHGGRELWLTVAGVDSGEGVVYTVCDVTGERRLEQLRSDLVAIVSHEMRTPLAGASGAAQTLLARFDDLDPEARVALLTVIVEQSARLTRIVDQIVVAGQIDTGQVDAGEVPLDPARIAREVVQAMPGAEARTAVEAQEGVEALGDPDLLRQVLASLLDNALKYSVGAVRIEVKRERAHARIGISDDGPGIAPEDRERVFEKFYRVDPEQRTGVGGTGLGLYIARALVERMQGRIALAPRDPGTTVEVDLPLATRR